MPPPKRKCPLITHDHGEILAPSRRRPAPSTSFQPPNEANDAIRTAVENAAGMKLQWARTSQPALASLQPIRNLLPVNRRSAILFTDHELTSYEFNDCRGMPTHLRHAVLDSVESEAQTFQQEVAPAAQAQGTRASYMRLWRSFVTFAIARDATDEILPTNLQLLQAYVWNLLRNGLRPGTIALHIQAIVDRHAKARLPFPVPSREIRGWNKAIQRLCAVPREEGPALTKSQLHAILRLPRTTLRDVRDAAIIALGVICAARPSEIAELDVCDILYDFDTPGVTAIRVKKRKNDQQRSGLWPRIGQSANPDLDVVQLL